MAKGKDENLALGGMLGCAVLGVILIGTAYGLIGYVGYHFIMKLW